MCGCYVTPPHKYRSTGCRRSDSKATIACSRPSSSQPPLRGWRWLRRPLSACTRVFRSLARAARGRAQEFSARAGRASGLPSAADPSGAWLGKGKGGCRNMGDGKPLSVRSAWTRCFTVFAWPLPRLSLKSGSLLLSTGWPLAGNAARLRGGGLGHIAARLRV